MFLGGIFAILSCNCKVQQDSNTSSKTNTTTSESTSISTSAGYENPIPYATTITSAELKENLYIFAGDRFEGRDTGKRGQKMAVDFLRDKYRKMAVPSPMGGDDYYQRIPSSFLGGGMESSENVLAYIEGSEKPEEVIVISAHLDHLGKTKLGQVFNGADDDGSGNVAILEIAEAFRAAQKNNLGPKRSILFLHVTGEERGLLGSKYYVENPVFPLENTVANLNIDMIGRIDPNHKDNPDYVYLIGSDKLSKELHQVSEKTNDEYVKIDLDYTYNDENDPNRFYYRSDHYNFAKNNVPVIFYFNGTHEDYHRASDTPDKIEYDLLEKRTKLIFHTAWEIANRPDRLQLNNSGSN
ncbi:M28 family metallopeptidase [Gangjinia marincola]|uniref:M28 family metallopeptidase n=1 Tax=Gangjinia marincola TaxID=578463 RepID=A0ABN1MCZ9_9FLAO